ncbi:hypothetical protein KOW79_008728 [Hemibagrus wyckioides]|uniref:Uncharacterized protein n=1 Tax=Hemibagrus wyckioides TaxID=337641 RepID=A0A9D3NUE8_9TELE|nr:hypothetical protein KOW79_008728 [Hemibagrus wyckioides]
MSGLTNVAMQDILQESVRETLWDRFKFIFKKKPGKSRRSKKNRLPEPENVLKRSGFIVHPSLQLDYEKKQQQK